MSDPRTRIVEQGYDVIGETFVEWRDRIVGDPRRRWADELTSRLDDGTRVLELGCGAGVPDTKLLSNRFHVTGVDISSEQIRRARSNVPDAEFIRADFTSLELEPASFEAVAAFYPPDTNRELLRDAGFEIVLDELVTFLEPDGEATFQWVLAQR